MSEVNILVISDTHGNSWPIEKLINNYDGLISHVIHLGDHARDMMRFYQNDNTRIFHMVNGNTDPLVGIFEDRVIEIANKRIFITHGHEYNVKLRTNEIIYKAQKLQVDVCLYGHTHIQDMYTKHNILFLNPGSLTYPQLAQSKGYALLHIGLDNNVTGKLLAYKEPDWRS